jgi:drug/metabolite transporter (DMT)-like permease
VTVVARARAASRERRALLAVVVAVVLWSACALFVRAGHTDALVFTTYRLWFALPPLALIVARRSRGREADAAPMWPRAVSPARWMLLMVGAGALFVSGAATSFAAIGLTRLLDVTLIGALEPALIIAVAIVFLRERAHLGNIARSAIAIVATVVVSVAASDRGTWSLAGDLVAVVSLVLNSGWFLYGRVLRKRHAVDPFAFMLATLTCAAVLLTPFAVVAHGNLAISGRGLFFAACTMVAGTTAHVLLVWAHRYVPTSISSPLLLGEPPVVAVGAWVFFGESLGAIEIVASVVVLASLWGVLRSPELEHVEDDLVDPMPPV